MMSGQGGEIIRQAGFDFAAPVGIPYQKGPGAAVPENNPPQDGPFPIRVRASGWHRKFLPFPAPAAYHGQTIIAAPMEIFVRIIPVAGFRGHWLDALRGIVAQGDKGMNDFRHCGGSRDRLLRQGGMNREQSANDKERVQIS